MLYKVLVDGKSCHGGEFTWSLPTDDQPGEWHVHNGKAIMCVSGFHVTENPAKWYKEGSSVYETECEDFVSDNPLEEKALYRKVRLLRRLSDDDLIKLKVIKGITTEVTGQMVACENASIIANNSTVRCFGNSIVCAGGKSVIKAYNTTMVFAADEVVVESYDNASVTILSDLVSVNAWGHSKVDFSRTVIKTNVNSIINGRIGRHMRQFHNWNRMPGTRLYDSAIADSNLRLLNKDEDLKMAVGL